MGDREEAERSRIGASPLGAGELADLFRSATLGLVRIDPATRRLLQVNPGMSVLTGFSETELLVVENGLAGALQNRLVKVTLDPIVQQ